MKKLFSGFLMLYLSLVFAGCAQSNIYKENHTSEIAEVELVPTNNSDTSVIDTNVQLDTNQQLGEEKAIYLNVPNDNYPLQTDAIPFSIVNNSGKHISVVLIPLLDRESDNGWERIDPIDVGFCGTPDQIDSQYIGDLPLSWYADSLVEGRYRLSYEIVNDNDYKPISTLSDIFVLEDFGAAMSVKESADYSKGITLVLTNNTEQEYNYGEHYTLERKSGGSWNNVDAIIQNYAFHDIGYTLRANQTSELVVDWEWLYGELGAGEYRITKDISYIRQPGDYDTYHLSAEFTIN